MYTGGRVVMKWWRSGGEEEVLRRWWIGGRKSYDFWLYFPTFV